MKTHSESALVDLVINWVEANKLTSGASNARITANTNLIESGLLDSFGFVDLILFIEQDNVLATTSWSADADIPGLKELARKYLDRFKEPMDSTSAGGFTAIAVLWDSLERAGSADRKKVRESIAATQLKTGEKMYMQLRGAKFVASGENERAGGLVFVIKDKTWVAVAPLEFAKGQAPFPKPKWGA